MVVRECRSYIGFALMRAAELVLVGRQIEIASRLADRQAVVDL